MFKPRVELQVGVSDRKVSAYWINRVRYQETAYEDRCANHTQETNPLQALYSTSPSSPSQSTSTTTGSPSTHARICFIVAARS